MWESREEVKAMSIEESLLLNLLRMNWIFSEDTPSIKVYLMISVEPFL